MKWAFCVLLFWGLNVCAQTFGYEPVRTYTQANGLPSNTLYDLLIDKKGFLWIASESGVTRFDGQKFQTFEAQGLPEQACLALYEDSLGRIWFFFGGDLYIWEKGFVHTPTNNKILAELKSAERYTSFVEINNAIYLGNHEGFYAKIKDNKVSKTVSEGYSITWQTETNNLLLGSIVHSNSKNLQGITDEKFLRLSPPWGFRQYQLRNENCIWISRDTLFSLKQSQLQAHSSNKCNLLFMDFGWRMELMPFSGSVV